MENVVVLEVVTKTNFSPERYLLANLDVRRVFGESAADAERHFMLYGRNENRYQISLGFLSWRNDREAQIARFDRLKRVLRNPPAAAVSFPVYLTDEPSQLDSFEGESAHPTPFHFAEEIAAHPENTYADIGAGFRNVIFPNCINVEIYPSQTTDVIIEPSSALPFNDSSLDGLGCFAVLEHVREPWLLAAEIARVVKPGGRVFIDWPFLQPVHGYPSHFYNATREGLRALFARSFDITSIGTEPHQGFDYTLSWIVGGLLNSISNPKVRKRFARMTMAQIAAEPPQSTFWKQVIGSSPQKAWEIYACGNSLIGKRKT